MGPFGAPTRTTNQAYLTAYKYWVITATTMEIIGTVGGLLVHTSIIATFASLPYCGVRARVLSTFRKNDSATQPDPSYDGGVFSISQLHNMLGTVPQTL